MGLHQFDLGAPPLAVGRGVIERSGVVPDEKSAAASRASSTM